MGENFLVENECPRIPIWCLGTEGSVCRCNATRLGCPKWGKKVCCRCDSDMFRDSEEAVCCTCWPSVYEGLSCCCILQRLCEFVYCFMCFTWLKCCCCCLCRNLCNESFFEPYDD